VTVIRTETGSKQGAGNPTRLDMPQPDGQVHEGREQHPAPCYRRARELGQSSRHILYADRGEVDGAFVYRTDALLAQQAKILLVVSQELYPQVTYPAALLKGAEKNSEAIDFFDFLLSPEGKQILMKYGFELAA